MFGEINFVNIGKRDLLFSNYNWKLITMRGEFSSKEENKYFRINHEIRPLNLFLRKRAIWIYIVKRKNLKINCLEFEKEFLDFQGEF